MPLAGKIVVTVGGLIIIAMLAYLMYELWQFSREVKASQGRR